MLYIEQDGVRIPRLGFGTYRLRDEEGTEVIEEALRTGYRLIDTAQGYKNEHEVGEAIRRSGVPRSEIFLTTKFWYGNPHGNEQATHNLLKSVDGSLERLGEGIGYIDMLLLHHPPSEEYFDSCIAALKESVEKGKVRHIGVSNFSIEQIQRAKDALGAVIITNQVEYHPYFSQNNEMLNYLRDKGMFLTAFCPLGKPLLKREEERDKLTEDETILALAKKYGKSSAQIILRWHMQQDSVVAIPMASNKEHVRSNFKVFDFELSADDMQTITDLQVKNQQAIAPLLGKPEFVPPPSPATSVSAVNVCANPLVSVNFLQ